MGDKLFDVDRRTDTRDEAKVALRIYFANAVKDDCVTHIMCFVLSMLLKTAGDQTIRSLFTQLCRFYANFVITGVAWNGVRNVNNDDVMMK